MAVSASVTSACSGGGEPGEATWVVDPSDPPSEQSESFTALVTRRACSGGETGEVLEPVVESDAEQVTITFTVAPMPDGVYTCDGNNSVPYRVVLDEPLGEKTLVDGWCVSAQADQPPGGPATTLANGNCDRWG